MGIIDWIAKLELALFLPIPTFLSIIVHTAACVRSTCFFHPRAHEVAFLIPRQFSSECICFWFVKGGNKVKP